jgi:peptidoglycan/LPS O-acetylase OafA/YrhL
MILSFRSNLTGSEKYRADVDGLRALAVLSVMFFHGGLFGCRGGFVGVDVFYVISGYLITSFIAKDIAEGRFSFSSFYERRMRRIFPALFAVLLFCALAAVVLFIPQDLIEFGKSLVATTLFVSNVFFWATAEPLGYFAHTVASQPLLHTWSLSVEEQFYLVFPAMLVLLFRWAKGRINVGLFLLAALSFGLSVWGTQHRPVATFYLSVPRAWELLIGALLATVAVPPLRSRVAREVAALLGLGLIVAAVFSLKTTTPFPGFGALLPCLGAGLIIYAGEHGASFTKTALSFRPLVFIGVISYSLYLWHWPLLVFGRYFAVGGLTNRETAAVLACSVIMAFLSFEFIERPFRGSHTTFTRRRIFALGLAASVTTLAVGFAVYLTHGFPVRYGLRTRELVAENIARRDDYILACGNWRSEVHSLADINFCLLGNPSSKKVMFWGDSHVEQMYPAVRAMYDRGEFRGGGALFAIANACLPAEHLNTVGVGGYHCDSFTHFAMMRAQEEDIDTVVIGFSTWWYGSDGAICASVDGRCTEMLSSQTTVRRLSSELADQLRTLRSLGKRVIVCLPFPMYDKSIPDLEVHNAVYSNFGLSRKATDVSSTKLREELQSIATGAGAEIFDPRLSLCEAGSCITEVNGVSIYKDSDHLAASQAGILEKNLQLVLE